MTQPMSGFLQWDGDRLVSTNPPVAGACLPCGLRPCRCCQGRGAHREGWAWAECATCDGKGFMRKEVANAQTY